MVRYIAALSVLGSYARVVNATARNDDALHDPLVKKKKKKSTLLFPALQSTATFSRTIAAETDRHTGPWTSADIPDIVITPTITGHHLHHRRSRGLLDGDAVRQCSRRAAVRLRRGPPWLCYADGDSYRSGEFHRGDLVGHDERIPLRGQPTTGPANSLEPYLRSAATATTDPNARVSPASDHTNLAWCTGLLGHERASAANGQRQLDLAERFLGGEQQRARTSPHTRQEVDRDTGRFLRRGRLRGFRRRARRWTSGRHPSFPLILGRISRRLELQPSSSTRISLFVSDRFLEPSSNVRG